MAFIQHCKSMKESGFNPKMVYRNLPPSHLYEKVIAACIRAAGQFCLLLSVWRLLRVHWAGNAVKQGSPLLKYTFCNALKHPVLDDQLQ